MSRKKDRLRVRTQYGPQRGPVAAAIGKITLGDLVALKEDWHEMLEVARRTEHAMGTTVGLLRRAGYSWQEIGDAVGVSRQAAHARWAAVDERFAARAARTPAKGPVPARR